MRAAAFAFHFLIFRFILFFFIILFSFFRLRANPQICTNPSVIRADTTSFFKNMWYNESVKV